MSTALRSIPQPRLRVSARYEHETIQFQGSIYDFLQHIIDSGWSGQGTFTVAKGSNFFGLEFDIRGRADNISVDNLDKP